VKSQTCNEISFLKRNEAQVECGKLPQPKCSTLADIVIVVVVVLSLLLPCLCCSYNQHRKDLLMNPLFGAVPESVSGRAGDKQKQQQQQKKKLY